MEEKQSKADLLALRGGLRGRSAVCLTAWKTLLRSCLTSLNTP